MFKTVALSGTSSFTALWIAQAFHKKGWKVLGVCPRGKNEYSGLKEKRLHLLSNWAEIYFSVRAENGGMEEWIARNHFDVWIHHHHFMEDFRSEKYDIEKAGAIGLKPLSSLLRALKKTGCDKIIFSGSYFEPGEGGQTIDSISTPYAKSKLMVWNELQSYSDFLLSKVVIPNPVGPLENEDRLIPVLIKNSLEQKEFTLTTPDALADQLPVRVLADSYVECAEMLLEGKAAEYRPSGLNVRNQEFIETVLAELIVKRLKMQPCKIKVNAAHGSFKNFSNPPTEKKTIDWASQWDHYAAVLKEIL